MLCLLYTAKSSGGCAAADPAALTAFCWAGAPVFTLWRGPEVCTALTVSSICAIIPLWALAAFQAVATSSAFACKGTFACC